jgi:hypothetical protein
VWSVTAMTDATQRLSQVTADDQPRGFTVISEAVWRVTIVDATLVRHHPAAYDAVIAGQTPAQRELIEGTLAGLRFVRNSISGEGSLGDFIEPAPAGPHAGEDWISGCGARCQSRRRQAGGRGRVHGTADTRSS